MKTKNGDDFLEYNTEVNVPSDILQSFKTTVEEYLEKQIDPKTCALGVCIGSLNWLTVQMYYSLRHNTHFIVKAPMDKNQVIILIAIVVSNNYFDRNTFNIK